MLIVILLYVYVYRIYEFEYVIWIILLIDLEYFYEIYLVNIECDLLKNEIFFSMDLI